MENRSGNSLFPYPALLALRAIISCVHATSGGGRALIPHSASREWIMRPRVYWLGEIADRKVVDCRP